MNGVSVRDARALLDVAGAVEYDCGRGAFTQDVLTALLDLLEADWVTYCEGPGGPTRSAVRSEVETRPFAGHNSELEATFAAHFHEFALGMRPAPEDGVLLIGDVLARRAWHRTGFYNEWCREVHVEPQAKLSMSMTGSPVNCTLMIDLADDTTRTFGERERTLLKLVRPSLMRPLAQVAAARARRRALGITPRELEVLGLVRDGLTNGEIAAQLFVSPATVRSHLEHAFAKIGAHTRTEAVARLGEIS